MTPRLSATRIIARIANDVYIGGEWIGVETSDD